MKNIARLVLALILFSIPSAQATDYTSSSFIVRDPVITVGGGISSSSSGFQVFSSIGQSATGQNTNASFTQRSGFLYFPSVTSPIVSATGGDGQVALTWTASSTALGFSVSGYQIGRSTTAGGPYTLTVLGNVLSSTVTGLANGTRYYFVISTLDAFGSVIVRSAEVFATPIAAPPQPQPSPGGGGGGGYYPPQPQPTGVTFEGRAYPNRTVTLVKDGQVAATTVAGPDAAFKVTLTGLSAGNYIFSIYSEDIKGLRSAPLILPVSVTAGVSTTIGGIFISPTIEVDKTEVKRGDNITIFGQSYPKTDIVIQVNSEEDFFVKTQADGGGVYLYDFDSSPLDLGEHTTKSKATQDGFISSSSRTVGFKVVRTKSKAKELPKPPAPDTGGSGGAGKCRKTDVNCDGKVNLIDFSIVSYWYKRPLNDAFKKKEKEHFNGDGKIDLKDFSIMAFYWTG